MSEPKVFETANWIWMIDGSEVRIVERTPDGVAPFDALHVDKREFAEALVGLGIVHYAHVESTKAPEHRNGGTPGANGEYDYPESLPRAPEVDEAIKRVILGAVSA